MSDPYADARREYADRGLAEDDLERDPFTMFSRWYDDAVRDAIHEPNAMVVASVGTEGRPSSRMVLLKGFDERGWVFFTNLGSRKGRELMTQPACALLFPWHPVERQVRVDGTATLLPRADVEAYFATRPRSSRLGAHASHQSRVVGSREDLETAWAAADAAYPDEVPVPEEWGGFRVVPDEVEFWQGRPGRLHDRHVYARSGPGWTTRRLAP